jgi:hypothetical protein
MPAGVELLTDPEEPIVRLMAVRLEVEEEEEGVGAEAAEGREGAEEGAEPSAEKE